MPSRPVTALIVAFWLGTLGWFGYREVWPKLRPGDAPPFVIELADEVTSQLSNEDLRPADALWLIYRGNEVIGRAQTRLRYLKEDDTFELQTRIVELTLIKKIIFIPELINRYRLSRAGELRGIVMTGEMTALNLYPGKARFEGTVRGDLMERKGQILLPFDKEPIELTFEPTAAPHGIFLNPMHPVPRVKGLRPGRRWQMPVVNPLADLVEPVLLAVQRKYNPGGKPFALKLPSGPKFLDAEVLTETAMASWNNLDHECLIIEYRGDNETFRTFVRKSDGQVLRQESQAPGGRFVIQRR